MPSVNFYHLNKTNTYFALCKLLNKAIGQGQKVLVRTSSAETTEEIDEILWSYDRTSFVPHSKLGDKHTNLNPIYITNETDNPNYAKYLFIIDTSNFSVSEICKFQRTFILFTDGDKSFLNIARKLWVDLSKFDIERKYWVEGEKGWVLRNET